MFKGILAIGLGLATMVTASAHVWNRPNAARRAPSFHASPCPADFAFRQGFCIRTVSAPSKIDADAEARKAWFAHAIEDILEDR